MKQLQYKKVFIKTKIKGGSVKLYKSKTFNLVAKVSFFITKLQITSMEKLLKLYQKKFWNKILVNTFLPVTSKGLSTRMGAGTGSVSYLIGKVKKGSSIVECKDNTTNSKNEILTLLKKVSHKLPISTFIIEKH